MGGRLVIHARLMSMEMPDMVTHLITWNGMHEGFLDNTSFVGSVSAFFSLYL